MRAEIHLEEKNDYVIMSLVGDFNNIDDSDKVRETFRDIAAKGKNKVIVNLKEVFYMNSSTLGALLSGKAILDKVKGNIILCNASDYINHILSITKLTLTFTMCGNLEEAAGAINKN